MFWRIKVMSKRQYMLALIAYTEVNESALITFEPHDLLSSPIDFIIIDAQHDGMHVAFKDTYNYYTMTLEN